MRRRISTVLAGASLVALLCAGVAFAGALDNGGGKGNGQPTTTATTANDPGSPGSPGNDCSHGSSDKTCRDDPNANGKDCADHGKAQGNEDHCNNGSTTTTTETQPQTHEVCKDGVVQSEPLDVADDGSCNHTTTNGGGCVSNCGGGTTTTQQGSTPPPVTTTGGTSSTPPVTVAPGMTPGKLKHDLVKQEAKAAKGVPDNAAPVSGQLPHTGLNAGLLAFFGAALLIAGALVRYIGSGAGVTKIGGAA